MGDGYYMRTKNDPVGEAGRKRVSLYGTVTMDEPYGNFRRASTYKPLPETGNDAEKEAQWKASWNVYDPPNENEQVPEFVRKNYPNLKLGPKATNKNFIPFRGSLEDEIDARERVRKSPGYQPLIPSGSIDYGTLPGEAARRDMNNLANWKTHRDRRGDGELMARDSWKEKGQDVWVRSPEFDRNQEDRRQGKLPALDSPEGRKQLQALYYDHMKETKREDEAKSGYYTDPYTRLQMPILNEHSTELDKAGAHFRGEFLGRNPAVRLWSGMQDLKEYEQTGNKWKAFNFFRKMAENGMDGLAIRGAMPEGSYGRVGGVASEGLYEMKPGVSYVGAGKAPPRLPKFITTGLNSDQVRFSQSNVKDTLSRMMKDMKKKGWYGDGMDVVEMPDKSYVTIDNTRLASAKLSGTQPRAHIHTFDEPFPLAREPESFKNPKSGQIPRTWGEALQNRIADQKGAWRRKYPEGSPFTGVHKNDKGLVFIEKEP